MNRRKIKYKETNFGCLICNLENGSFYKANKCGLEILKLLNDNKSMAEIVSIISNKYGSDKKIVEQDVKGFVDKLSKLKVTDAEETYA